MKSQPVDVRRTVLTRVIVAWTALSVLAGAVVFFVEVGARVRRIVLGLATNETRGFTEHIEAIGPEHAVEESRGILATLAPIHETISAKGILEVC